MTMKKLFFLFFISIAFYSCSPTINQSLYSKNSNPKELITSKYGEPTSILQTNDSEEVWKYDYVNPFKSNRTVTFDVNNKILKNKKHYKPFIPRKGHFIAIGVIMGVYIINDPFPALL